MPEQECWVVQYRIKSKSKPNWEGTRWVMHHEYFTQEKAVRRCDHMREKAAQRVNDCDEEWRVLHVTQEVVY